MRCVLEFQQSLAINEKNHPQAEKNSTERPAETPAIPHPGMEAPSQSSLHLLSCNLPKFPSPDEVLLTSQFIRKQSWLWNKHCKRWILKKETITLKVLYFLTPLFFDGSIESQWTEGLSSLATFLCKVPGKLA